MTITKRIANADAAYNLRRNDLHSSPHSQTTLGAEKKKRLDSNISLKNVLKTIKKKIKKVILTNHMWLLKEVKVKILKASMVYYKQ